MTFHWLGCAVECLLDLVYLSLRIFGSGHVVGSHSSGDLGFESPRIHLSGWVDNNNNCKTSIAPISSKRIELSSTPSTGVRQTQSKYDAKFINK